MATATHDINELKRRMQGAIGVLKAYTTRVGGGPFPSELEGATGDFLRQRGDTD